MNNCLIIDLFSYLVVETNEQTNNQINEQTNE